MLAKQNLVALQDSQLVCAEEATAVHAEAAGVRILASWSLSLISDFWRTSRHLMEQKSSVTLMPSRTLASLFHLDWLVVAKHHHFVLTIHNQNFPCRKSSMSLYSQQAIQRIQSTSLTCTGLKMEIWSKCVPGRSSPGRSFNQSCWVVQSLRQSSQTHQFNQLFFEGAGRNPNQTKISRCGGASQNCKRQRHAMAAEIVFMLQDLIRDTTDFKAVDPRTYVEDCFLQTFSDTLLQCCSSGATLFESMSDKWQVLNLKSWHCRTFSWSSVTLWRPLWRRHKWTYRWFELNLSLDSLIWLEPFLGKSVLLVGSHCVICRVYYHVII